VQQHTDSSRWARTACAEARACQERPWRATPWAVPAAPAAARACARGHPAERAASRPPPAMRAPRAPPLSRHRHRRTRYGQPWKLGRPRGWGARVGGGGCAAPPRRSVRATNVAVGTCCAWHPVRSTRESLASPMWVMSRARGQVITAPGVSLLARSRSALARMAAAGQPATRCEGAGPGGGQHDHPDAQRHGKAVG
jgi:hypothetical protein